MGIRVVAPLGVALAVGHAASAQVSPTTGVVKFYGSDNVGSFMELAGGPFVPTSTASGGSMQFTLTGDARLNLDPDENAALSRELVIGGVQQFTVDAFPTMITPEIDAHFKVVNAGGPPAPSMAPVTLGSARMFVYLTGSYMHGGNDFSGLGERVAAVEMTTFVQGNGFDILDEGFLAPEGYVLLPGESYTVIWEMQIRSYLAGLPSDSPPTVAYLEAGGITDFDGMFFDLNAVVVPAPGAAALGALALCVAARRRR